MAYEKTVWQAREGENLDNWAKLDETADSVVLINAPDSITSPGTPFSPENMNKIEEGIGGAHDLIAAETGERREADQALQAETRGLLAAAQALQEADQNLQSQINTLQNIADMPDGGSFTQLFAAKQDKIAATGSGNLLTAPEIPGGQPGSLPLADIEAQLASKAPINSPVFTGLLRANIGLSTAFSDVLVAAANGAVYKRPASGLAVGRAAQADHAATAATATNKAAASGQIISQTSPSQLTLATWADVVHTVAHMLLNPPPAPAAVTVSEPPSTVYAAGIQDPLPHVEIAGDTVDFSAGVTPDNALGVIIDWGVTGNYQSYETLQGSGNCRVVPGQWYRRESATGHLENKYTVTATVRGTSISHSRVVNLTRRPGTKP